MGALVSFLIPQMVLVTAAVCQWDGPLSIAVADSVSYIHAGLALIKEGRYINSFGTQELWFPPLYPAVIGLLNQTGANPFHIARVVSLFASIVTLTLVWSISKRTTGTASAFAAGVVLACNPIFQLGSVAALSEATATMLAVIALWLWVFRHSEKGYWREFLAGGAIAASYLTRPEAFLLLVLWLGYDCFVKGSAPWLRRAVTVGAFLMIAGPYIVWLSSALGWPALSGKGEVNLAAGRAQYYGLPRERINPVTLESEFASPPLTLHAELRRYASNLFDGAATVAGVLDGRIVGLILLCPLIAGLSVARRYWSREFLWVLLSPFSLLLIIAWYAVSPRYLHIILPGVAMVTGLGLVRLCDTQRSYRPVIQTLVRFVIVAACGLALAETGTRWSRWALDGTGDLALLKKAGDVIHDKAEKCRLYEVGATVGYYGGCLRARLTSDPLSTILAHARMQGSGFKGVTYLSVETRHLTTYHPTVAALLDPVQSPFAVVVDMTDGRNRVLVYRIDLMAGGKWHAEPGGILPRTIEASRLQQ